MHKQLDCTLALVLAINLLFTSALPLRGEQQEPQSTESIASRMGLAELQKSIQSPKYIRFSETKRHSESLSAIGACSCDFLSAVGPKKPVGSTPKCAPINALCMFCMNAAFNTYWETSKDTCAEYIGDAQSLCKSIAGSVSSAKKEMEAMYLAYGPSFGASAAYCREGGCCAGSD